MRTTKLKWLWLVCLVVPVACATSSASEQAEEPAESVESVESDGEEVAEPRVEPPEPVDVEPDCRYAEACWKAGVHGWMNQDRPAATVKLQRACELDEDYCARVYKVFRTAEAYVEARHTTAHMCRRHTKRACVTAALLYRTIEPVDLKAADDMLVLGCDAEDAEACFDLAVNYERGIGREKDTVRAVELYDENCERGHLNSCQNLAVSWIRAGGEQDAARAVAMFEKLCDGGYKTACVDLGDRLIKGRDVARDVDRGIAILDKACRTGDGYACAFYGQALAMPSGSISDARLAYDVLKRGCALGSGRACLFAARGFKKSTEVTLTDEERQTLAGRALSLFETKCRSSRAGRACGMAASILREGDAGHTDLAAARELKSLGCEYDSRVCKW